MRAIEASGIARECELIVVADRPPGLPPASWQKAGRRIDRLIQTDVSDLGLARNVGVNASRGELVLFLDGDDLWGSNWVPCPPGPST